MVVMPIFMDRHNMRDATAEQVAEAHRRDLDIQDKYGVKYMTYWYDAARGTGFCLVERPMPRLQRTFTARPMARYRPTSSRLTSLRSRLSSAASAIRV
jgi:Protein of unknown function (DUF4242)